MSEDITTTEETGLTQYDPELLGAGFENASPDDIEIPSLVLINDKADMLDKHSEVYNEDAEAGMFWIDQTGEVYNELHIVPVCTSRVVDIMENSENPKRVGRTTLDDEDVVAARAAAKKTQNPNKWISPDGQLKYVDVLNVFCLVLDSPDAEEPTSYGIFRIKSTKWRSWRRIYTRMMQRRLGPGLVPAMFTNRITIVSVYVRDDHSYYTTKMVPSIDNDPDASALPMDKNNPIVAAALSLKKLVDDGSVTFNEHDDEPMADAEISQDNF